MKKPATGPAPPAGPSQALDLSRQMVGICLNASGQEVVQPHHHPHYEILYILRGARQTQVRGKRHVARSGDILVFRPGEHHEEKCLSQTISFIVLRFTPEQLRQGAITFPTPAELPPVLRLPHRKRFLNLFQRLHEEYKEPGEDTPLLLGVYLIEFVVLLRRAVAAAAAAHPVCHATGMERVQAALGLLEGDLHRPVQLETMARQAFMSVSHFAHLFKEQVGEPPKRFLIRERIEEAKTLLRTTARPASEIAATLGYRTPSFFYRQFKTKTGMTPTEFRTAEK